MEIGFGNGDHLVEQAEKKRDINFIGIEVFENGVASASFKILKRKLKNIKIFYGDTRDVVRILPKETIDRYYILFPDPWPKKRHHQRRLLIQENIEILSLSLRKSGSVCIATDILDYKSQIIKVFSTIKVFKKVEGHSRKQCSDWFLENNTKYEERAISCGKKPFYLVYQKI